MSELLKQNCEIVGSIYKTNDLDMFNCCKYNRVVDPKHVNNLVKSMKKDGFNGDPIRVFFVLSKIFSKNIIS